MKMSKTHPKNSNLKPKITSLRPNDDTIKKRTWAPNRWIYGKPTRNAKKHTILNFLANGTRERETHTRTHRFGLGWLILSHKNAQFQYEFIRWILIPCNILQAVGSELHARVRERAPLAKENETESQAYVGLSDNSFSAQKCKIEDSSSTYTNTKNETATTGK